MPVDVDQSQELVCIFAVSIFLTPQYSFYSTSKHLFVFVLVACYSVEIRIAQC